MPELARLGVTAPVVLVGCKADAAPGDAHLQTAVVPVMHRHKQIETCLECSAKKLVFVGEVRGRLSGGGGGRGHARRPPF
jgi:Ras family protein T1